MNSPGSVFVASFVALSASAFAQIEPDQPLSIPSILKTPHVAGFSVASDGKRVALNLSVLGKETIWLIPGDGSVGGPVPTSKTTGERDAEWSPDGRQLAFVSNRNGGWHLYVSDAEGTHAKRVTEGDEEAGAPRWSPDGRSIAYLARDEGSETGWDLAVVSLGDEPRVARRISTAPADEEDPRWSPDGKRIAVTLGGGRHQNRTISLVVVESGERSALLSDAWKGDSFSPRWFPSNEEILFVSDEPGHLSLFRTAATGGEPQAIVRSEYEVTEPAMSPDGRYVTYIENRDGDMKLQLYEFQTSRERTLTLRNGVHSSPIWRSDGKAVLSLFEAWNYSRDVWAYPLEGGRERVSDTLPPELDVRQMVRPELVRFASFDGREITGYLYVPVEATPERPAKLLVRPHGGPTSQWKNGWHPFTQLLAQKGYAIFAPNVRGSSGFGVGFAELNDGDWGRGDLEDLAAGTKRMIERPEIRDDRVGIWGVSYGGFLTLTAITRHPDLFACAIEALGMPDLERLYRDTTDEGRNYLEREIGPLRGHLELYRELSPVREVDRVSTPLLSFHGQDYPLVPYSVKQSFFDSLRRRPSYPLREYIFKGSEARATYRHDLHPEAAWAYVEKILEFLDIYL